MDVSSATDTLMFQGVIFIKTRTNFRSYIVVSILCFKWVNIINVYCEIVLFLAIPTGVVSNNLLH